MAAGDLTTLADLKAWLGISNTTDDAQLGRLITAASDFIVQYCSRTFVTTAVTGRKYHGNGNRTLVLRNWPIVSIELLQIDGITIDPSLYSFYDRAIYLDDGYVFTQGIANITVNYTAGYATVPFGLAQACIELCSLKYRTRERIGHESKSIGGETVTFTVRDLHPEVKKALDQYSDKVPA